MSSGLLTLSKYVFLAVLYLFFLRVLRAVWVELREPKVVPVAAPAPTPDAEAPAPSRDGRRGRAGSEGRRGRRNGADHPVLRVTAPEELRGQAFDLGEELTVGRAAGCGISLPDDTFVSQLHARVFRRDGDLWVEDLGSTNGTLLNDRRVSAPAVMREGDVLHVGRTVLELST